MLGTAHAKGLSASEITQKRIESQTVSVSLRGIEREGMREVR